MSREEDFLKDLDYYIFFKDSDYKFMKKAFECGGTPFIEYHPEKHCFKFINSNKVICYARKEVKEEDE